MRIKKRIFAAIMVIAMAATVFTGCGGGSAQSQNQSSTSANTSSSADSSSKTDNSASSQAASKAKTVTIPIIEVTANADGTRTITDNADKKVTIPATVSTYVESWFAHNAVDCMLEGAKGMVITCAKPESYQWMYMICPNMSNAEYMEFSDSMNVESILAKKPDIVFGSNENYRAMFENVGLPFVNVQFSDYQGMARCIALTAEIFGEDAKKISDEYLNYLNGMIEKVNGVVGNIPDSEKVSVLHGDNLYNMTVDGANTIINEWIEYAGGINAPGKNNEVSGNKQSVNIEQILTWDPDIIISGANQEEIDNIMGDTAWAGLKAVQNKKVVLNPKGVFTWDRYAVEEALQLVWAAQLFYPDKTSSLDIVSETQSFFKKFFNYDLTADQVNLMLQRKNPA